MYAFHHVKYYVIHKNLKVYGYQGYEPVTKVFHQLNGIRCDKMSTAVTTVKTLPDRDKKDFDTAVAYLSQYVEKS